MHTESELKQHGEAKGGKCSRGNVAMFSVFEITICHQGHDLNKGIKRKAVNVAKN